MDPLDKELQELARPVYSQAIREAEQFNAELSERSRELEAAGYHAQIHVESQSTLLFINQDGKRCAVHRIDGRFHIKGTETWMSEEQLLAVAEQECWRLTPNVALRPMVQDHLLPTAAYIAGPSEVAYFAQLGPLYERCRRAMPVIYPRPSFTLMDQAALQIVERYQIELVDLLYQESEVLDRAFAKRLPEPVAQALAAAGKGVPSEFDALKGPLAELDPTLAEALEHIRQKVSYQLEALRTKLVHAEARGHQDMARELRACLTTVYPNQNLQEREISILSFMARFGPGLIEKLGQETDLSCPDHRILEL
jgi:bacillithiol biosynthesis cysteine-adding enzyme BshC